MTRRPATPALLPDDQIEEQRRTVLQPVVRCRRCRRKLHDPESRTLLLGPECRDRAEHIPHHDVDQDPLFGE